MKATKKYIEKLIEKIFQQADTGKFKIGNEQNGLWIFYVQFSNNKSNSVNTGEPTIVVRNKEVFISCVGKYLLTAREFYSQDKSYFELDDTSFDEKLLMDLFVNATNFDLNNIEKFIEQRTQMLTDCSTKCEQVVIGQYLKCDILAKTSKNKSNLEGPFKFEVSLNYGNESFILPSVCFGRIKNQIYIYSIQGEKKKQENKLSKQLDRYFRKANKNIDIEDEILSKVSTNALVSLTIFLAYQKFQGVDKLTAYNFMPIRYNSNLTAGLIKNKTEEKQQEFIDKHDKNQFNISNKFFNTIIRYAHHFNLNAEYDDVCEKLNLNLNHKSILDDHIINIIDNAISHYLKDIKEEGLNI